eukprot:10071809-Karenia_brevis.AAC.2
MVSISVTMEPPNETWSPALLWVRFLCPALLKQEGTQVMKRGCSPWGSGGGAAEKVNAMTQD